MGPKTFVLGFFLGRKNAPDGAFLGKRNEATGVSPEPSRLVGRDERRARSPERIPVLAKFF
jgi:hypothetical protein